MKKTPDYREVIVVTWTNSGERAVSARTIRNVLRALKQAGYDDAVSPAAIARVLADEGAELRHPDVIECDARWRQARLKKQHLSQRANTDEPLTLELAESLLIRLETARGSLAAQTDPDQLRRLKDAALNEKAKAQLLARDDSLNEMTRKTQKEIAEWFRVWLQTPEIFSDWLDLRRRAPEFLKTFNA